jgi:dipeptidase E
MKKIVAIGGGEIGRPGCSIETEKIDREIIKLTRKKSPKILFIPTASGDSELYWKTFDKYFGDKLKCKTDVLYLIKDKLSISEIKKKILGSDAVYVGGGNTLRMLKIWRKKGVDKILKSAAKKGIVLSGLSAGAICWFEYGNSDSLKFSPRKSKELMKVRGLGLIDSMLCPHYDVEKHRKYSLRKMVKEKGGVALALENCSAIEIIGDKYRIIVSSRRANAYKVFKKGNMVIERKLVIDGKFRPVENIISLSE